MVEDLFIPVEVALGRTLRESDGLALSTANRRLSDAQRSLAPRLFATLTQYAKKIDAGARDYESLQRQAAADLATLGLTPEYFVIRQAADLAPVRAGARELVLIGAVRAGQVRLTDSLRARLIERH
jgi:pantoate--beta-alanine ligase